MSLRTLSKHLSEAKYAHSWSDARDSSDAKKHKQYAINRFHRAVRRSKREIIAEALEASERDERIDLPVFGQQVYHAEGHGTVADEVGLWDMNLGEYVIFRDEEGWLYNHYRLRGWL